jgi:hypothetical protein
MKVVQYEIIDHKGLDFEVLEIISRIGESNKEAPRIYISSITLYNKFILLIDDLLKQKKKEYVNELLTKTFEVEDQDTTEEEKIEKINQELALEYIDSRLIVPVSG